MASAWLDRLSVASNPTSRRGSPVPRKPPGTPPRPGPDSRSTSLSVLTRVNSSASSPSRGNQAKSAVPLGLRQEAPQLSDIPDPLQVLQEIVGQPVARGGQKDDDLIVLETEEIDGQVEFQELSLTEYLLSPDDAQITTPIAEYSVQTAEEYEKERGKFEELHKTIARCEEVLQSVEASLVNFQNDLGAVSAEIETLQDRSTALSTRLENRKTVEKLLGPAAEDVSISPAIVKTLSEGPINEEWVRSLAEFEKRGKAIDAKLKDGSTMKAAQDVKPILENLRNRVNERIRDHITGQIKAMRSPNINAQIIQQSNLYKYKDLFSFLSKHQNKLSEDIVQAYVNTMKWYYSDHFSRYRQALEKLKVVLVGKEDTIGTDPTISRGARPGASSALFELGRRGEVSLPVHTPALSSYLASEDKSAHHIEVPYRNFLLAIVDNISAEYQFMTTFFSALPFSQVGRRCVETFSPALNNCRDMTKSLLEAGSLDCLGILLCIRVTQKLAFELQRRKIPVLDDHVNGLLILLWPAFQKAMDSHTESIKTLSSSLSAKSAASKLTFGVGGGSSAGDALVKASMAPHFLTQRFGQFLYGILTISRESGDDEPVASSLTRMRSEYESFLTKAAKTVGGADKGRRVRFVENQLVLIRTIVSNTEGKLAGEVKSWLQEVVASSTSSK